jgi:hypothetical protein
VGGTAAEYSCRVLGYGTRTLVGVSSNYQIVQNLFMMRVAYLDAKSAAGSRSLSASISSLAALSNAIFASFELRNDIPSVDVSKPLRHLNHIKRQSVTTCSMPAVGPLLQSMVRHAARYPSRTFSPLTKPPTESTTMYQPQQPHHVPTTLIQTWAPIRGITPGPVAHGQSPWIER